MSFFLNIVSMDVSSRACCADQKCLILGRLQADAGLKRAIKIACRNASVAAGSGLGDMKVHKTRLEKDKEAWHKAVRAYHAIHLHDM